VSARSRQFVEVYRTARVEDQRVYYLRRAKEFEAANRQLLLVSSLVFGVSGAVGLIAGLDVPGKLVWAILAAILPAITAALSAFEGLYGFNRVAKRFNDAARNLRLVEAPRLSGTDDERAALIDYVGRVEGIFRDELGQWGQLAAEQLGEQEQT
jgi:hypothetical protein